MGLFDRIRRVPRETSAPTWEMSVVPEGGSLEVYGTPPPLPTVQRLKGGGIIASQGVSSDRPLAALTELLESVDEALRGGPSEVLFPGADVLELSDVFSPDRQLKKIAHAIFWILNPESMLSSSAAPALLQVFRRHVFRLASHTSPPVSQIAYVQDLGSPGGLFIASLLSDVGIQVRKADTTFTEGVVAQVQRPDGVLVTAPLGRPVQENMNPDRRFFQIIRQKYRAQVIGDLAEMERLEREERDNLAERIASIQGKVTKAVERAPHLHRLLRQQLQGTSEALHALMEELVLRETHFLFFVNPKNRATHFQTWPQFGKALPVFPDRISIRLGAQRQGYDNKTWSIADAPPREVFAWMANISSGLAINLVLDDEKSHWVILPAEKMRALSEGRLPD